MHIVTRLPRKSDDEEEEGGGGVCWKVLADCVLLHGTLGNV